MENTMSNILTPQQPYTFSKIFDLKIAADDLANEFGYTFKRDRLSLSQYKGELDRFSEDLDPLMRILV
jgi:hypothetical protein